MACVEIMSSFRNCIISGHFFRGSSERNQHIRESKTSQQQISLEAGNQAGEAWKFTDPLLITDNTEWIIQMSIWVFFQLSRDHFHILTQEWLQKLWMLFLTSVNSSRCNLSVISLRSPWAISRGIRAE